MILSNRYQLIEQIGEGGMGVIYRARHLELDSVVAVKMLRTDIANDGELLQRFRREAQLLARLSDTRIVRFFDFGRDGDTYYFVTELLAGKNLRDYLADHVRTTGSPLALREVVRIGMEVARALRYAHGFDPPIVHRDVKPSNIFVEDHGRVVVTDFGIAKLAGDGRFDLTRSAGFVGTVRYCAPEQLRHDHGIDGRADVYALGLVLYELYTGEHLYQELTEQEVIGRVLYDPPPLPPGLVHAQPAFARVLARAIATDPKRRHPSAEALLADLEDCAHLIAEAPAAAPPGDDLDPPFAETVVVPAGTGGGVPRTDGEPASLRTARWTMPTRGMWAWIAARWWAVATCVGALLIAVPCVRDGVTWIGRPFPGFFLMENRVAPTASAYHWTGMRAGVPFHGTLTHVDGKPLDDANAVYRHAEALPIGTAVRYRFEKDGEAMTREVATMRFSLVDYGLAFGLLHLDGTVIVLMGLVVAILSPQRRQARVFFWMCLLMGLFPITGTSLYRDHRFTTLHFLLQCLAPASFVHLALVFPVDRQLPNRRRYVAAIYAAALGLAGLVLYGFWAEPAWLTPLHAAYAFTVVGLLALVGGSLHAYVRHRNAMVRGRVQVVLLGTFAAFSLPVGGFLNNVFGGGTFPINLIAFTPLFFFVAVSYAIVRHKLFDAQLIARRVVEFLSLLAVYGALWMVVVGTATRLDVAIPMSGAALFVALAVATSVPLRGWLRPRLDAWMFPHKRRLRDAIVQVSQAIGRLTDVSVMLDQTLQLLASGMGITSGLVLLRDENGEAFVEAAASGSAPKACRLAVADPLIQVLTTTRREVFVEDLLEDPKFFAIREQCLVAVRALRVDVLLPLLTTRGLIGVLAFGRPPESDTLTSEDLDVLRSMAAGISLVVRRRLDLHRATQMTVYRETLARCLPRSASHLRRRGEPWRPSALRATAVASVCVRVGGLDRLVERASPEATFDLLREVYKACAAIAGETGGVVERHEGGRTIVVFRATDGRRIPTDVAVHAALRLRERVEDVLASWRSVAADLAVGCGIAVGLAHLDGTADAPTAFGEPMRTAEMLSETAAAGTILATRDVVRGGGVVAFTEVARAAGVGVTDVVRIDAAVAA